MTNTDTQNPTVTDAIIVGAGPVGLTLAIDLGRRGVRCTLIEQKSAPHMWPKMERCNARSMEIYRRLGLSEKIRAAGLPTWVPMDVFIVHSLVEPPLVEFTQWVLVHLGHWVGSLENRVRLQDDYDCYFLIANVHAFTTRAAVATNPA